MHGCLERTPEFLREGARIEPYSRSFQLEIERMVRPVQAAIIKGGLRAAWRFVRRGAVAFFAAVRIGTRAFFWFWNVPVLRGGDIREM
jgi:hypothetical protein